MAIWTDEKLKMATIGCGRMGAQTSPSMRDYAPPHLRVLSHLEAARSLGLAYGLGASDIVPGALSRAQETYALDHVTPDYVELIASFQPDILTVATRTPDKATIIAAAAAAGIRALHVEKPLCNSGAELASISRLVADHDLLLTSGCLRRYLSPFRAAEALFASHGLGSISHVSIGMGAATLMWTQFHALDLILFYAGGRKLEWVQANLGPVVWSQGQSVVENDPLVISATLGFEGGFTGVIGQTIGNTTTLSSSLGQLEFFADGRSTWLSRRTELGDPYLSKLPETLDSGHLSGTQAPLWHLAKALGGDKASEALVRKAGLDFQLAQLVAFALIESDRAGGARVPMADFATDLTILGMTDGRYA